MPPSRVTRAAVARHAGVDPALIRYYFKDRESLLWAVVEELIAEREKVVQSLRSGTAPERLRAQIQSFFGFNAANPFFHRLLIEELAGSRSARGRALFHRLNQTAIAGYAQIVQAGAREKSLRKVDPALLHVAVAGMCEFFLGSQLVLQDAFGKKAQPEAFGSRYANMICDMVVQGLGRS